MNIYLAELTVYDPAIAGTKVLRYATHGYTSQPTDTPPNEYYEQRMEQPALMRRDVFAEGTTGGESQVGYGVMVLTNADGGLDGLLNYGFDGRALTIRMGDQDAALSTFATVQVGTMEQPEVGWDKVTIRLRDRQAELDKPIQANKYAGSNALPNGLEGVLGDLKGKPKSLMWGQIFNAAPPCVNTALGIYQLNDGAVYSGDASYDRGAALTKGADYVSQADMLATAPATSGFRVWPAGGYFRIGTYPPAGLITADATQGANAAARTVAQIIQAIVTGPGGIAPADVTAADITALDTATSAVVGIWIPEEMTIKAALDQIAASIGAWWGFDRLGKFRVGQLTAPSGTPVATLTTTEIVGKVERTGTSDADRGVPAWRVNLSYKRFWTRQDSDLAAGVTGARRAELGQEWRGVKSEDATVKTAHLLAPELNVETLLVDPTAAQAEADRRRDLYKVRRDRFNVSVRLDPTLATVLDLGAVVSLQIPRFGLDAGKLFRIIGIEPNLRIGAFKLTLWG